MMIDFLQRYLEIDTSFPNPRYQEVITLFIQQAAQDGFLTKVVELLPLQKAAKSLITFQQANIL